MLGAAHGVSPRNGAGPDGQARDPVATLSGTDFQLEVGATQVNFTGVPRYATVVNGQLPAPLLRWRQGDTVTIRVTNRLPAPTSIHWHGMILPANMDGVPGISFPGIHPGETYEYRFPVTRPVPTGTTATPASRNKSASTARLSSSPATASGIMPIASMCCCCPTGPTPIPSASTACSKSKAITSTTTAEPSPTLSADARKNGLSATVSDRRMWGQMRMNASDLLDVSGHAYTYLMNGVTPAGNWTCLFRRGEKVRLRVINGSSMSFFDIRIPGLAMTVVAADGQDVEPVTVDEFRIGAAEVYDVIVEPKDDRAYTIFAQSMDHTGYARATLAPAAGMSADIPPLDPPAVLSMADMGMSMSSMHHAPRA